MDSPRFASTVWVYGLRIHDSLTVLDGQGYETLNALCSLCFDGTPCFLYPAPAVRTAEPVAFAVAPLAGA